jgi:glycosyltransferase involved in cell wall biosynthesis
MKLGILTSHPIQYQAPWFRELAKVCDLMVYFAYKPNSTEQGHGFGQAFTWDVDLLVGYPHEFLKNLADQPSVIHFKGCDTPSIGDRVVEKKFDAFIVTGWYLKCHWQAVRACRKMGVPVLVRGDSQLLTPRSRWKALAKSVVYQQMLKRFDGFLTVGERNREYLQHYGVAKGKIYPAPHFIDNTWFSERVKSASTRIAQLRQAWNVQPNELVLLFAGKFIPEKNLACLLEACALLRSSNTVQPKLIMIGSGPLETSLREVATRLDIHPIWLGFKNQSELPAHYAAADVLVLPSQSETWGLVVNEAMACGIPAIVSDACGCAPDLIEEAETGYVFPCGDASKLAARLLDCAKKIKAGHSWKAALQLKLDAYSVDSCTRGTLLAVEKSAIRAR